MLSSRPLSSSVISQASHIPFLSFSPSLSFSHFPYHYAVSRMCGVWCSSCFLSPGLLIGVTAFTCTLVYCVSVEEQWVTSVEVKTWCPKTLFWHCIGVNKPPYSMHMAYDSVHLCDASQLLHHVYVDYSIATVFKKQLCTCFMHSLRFIQRKPSRLQLLL